MVDISKIRKGGMFLRAEKLSSLCSEISSKLKGKGYTSYCVPVSQGGAQLSDVRLSDEYVKEKGRNVSPFTGRRGRILGWENWVEVNDAINDVLDKKDISANVKSLGGLFIIREGKDRKTESDWEERAYDNVGSIMAPVYRIDAWRPEED